MEAAYGPAERTGVMGSSLGGLISAPFMYASTLAIGRVAELYFESGDLDDREMKAIYQETLKKAKSSFDPSRARSTDARREAEQAAPVADRAPETQDPLAQLERLSKLRDAGAVSQDEYDVAKRRILASL